MVSFSATNFYKLYKPSKCEKRVWLITNRPELAEDDIEFIELLKRRGKILEFRHLATLGSYQEPRSHNHDYRGRYEETLELIENQTPIIYQPVLLDPDGLFAIPDFLIFEPYTQKYKLRDVKLAINIKEHPEIALQLGLYRLAVEKVLGYTPNTEIVLGDSTLIDFEPASESEVISAIEHIISIKHLKTEPFEPVGWSKCNQCVFFNYCWAAAVCNCDISTVPYVDQSACIALANMDVTNYDHLHEFSEELLADIKRPWGKRVQKIGPTTAKKIKLQINALKTNQTIIGQKPELPTGFSPYQRPVVIFDIEDDPFDPDLGVRVYLWGVLISGQGGLQQTNLFFAEPGIEGDEKGWFDFLNYAFQVFENHGEIPFIHYSAHERTMVNKYIERYGDPCGIADRVLNNLWDMYPCIVRNLFLPVHSYGLKHLEKLVGFERSQADYGGLWSIIQYDKYVQAPTTDEAEAILTKILTYNAEDLAATLKVYEWLESIC
ncbi:MAG: hypothetical protein VR67_05525 [Peptococcaceae bacterium BRH_c8a]|nr:MAG: hypothetical protein VR67_05525 [Peptococcaceae bacterium BRH_c8a]